MSTLSRSGPGSANFVDIMRSSLLTVELRTLSPRACDIFGLGINNPKLIADELALKTGLVVYVPDLLEGEICPGSRVEARLCADN